MHLEKKMNVKGETQRNEQNMSVVLANPRDENLTTKLSTNTSYYMV